MSRSITGVDVVRLHHHPREFLGGVVHLVRRLGTAEHAEAMCATGPLFAGCSKTCGNTIEGFVPRCRNQFTVDPHPRRRKSRPRQMLLCLVFSHEPSPARRSNATPCSTLLAGYVSLTTPKPWTISQVEMSLSDQLLQDHPRG